MNANKVIYLLELSFQPLRDTIQSLKFHSNSITDVDLVRTHSFISSVTLVTSTTFEGVGRFDNPVTRSAISSRYFICYILYRLCNNVMEIFNSYNLYAFAYNVDFTHLTRSIAHALLMKRTIY